MEELEDLGEMFADDRRFCFDRIIIHEIVFDETNDVTLFCTVPYYGQLYTANFGLTFEQLNILLRSNRKAGEPVATAVAEKLDGELERPSVVEIDVLYGRPLDIHNCILYTTLFDLSGQEGEEDEDDDEEDSPIPGLPGSADAEEDEEEDDDDDNYVAYAFLVDEIVLKRPNEMEN